MAERNSGPIRRTVFVDAGTNVRRESKASGPISVPKYSVVRFERIGNKFVLREYDKNGKPRDPSIRHSRSGSKAPHYNEGDFFYDGTHLVKDLKRRFPDVAIHAKDYDFWDALEFVQGEGKADEIEVLERIDKIVGDPTDQWSGTVHTSFYLVINNVPIPASGRNSERVLRAFPGGGSLNDFIGITAPLLQHLEFLSGVISTEIKVIHQVLIEILTGAAMKAVKATKAIRLMLKTKRARKLKKVLKAIDDAALLKACKEFGKEFAKAVAKSQLDTGSGAGMSTVTEEGAVIYASGPSQNDIRDGIIRGAAAFAKTLLIEHSLAGPVAKAIGKKLEGNMPTKMAAKMADSLKDYLTGVGHDLTMGAIAEAMIKAQDDKTKTYADHLADQMGEKLKANLTEVLLKNLLTASASGADAIIAQ